MSRAAPSPQQRCSLPLDSRGSKAAWLSSCLLFQPNRVAAWPSPSATCGDPLPCPHRLQECAHLDHKLNRQSGLARLGSSSATHLTVERACVHPRLHVAGSVAHGTQTCVVFWDRKGSKGVDSKPQFSLETVGWLCQASPLLGEIALWR